MRVFDLFITYTVLHVSSTVFYTYIGGLVILMSLFVAVHAQSVCVPFSLFCVAGKKIIHVVDATLATMYLIFCLSTAIQAVRQLVGGKYIDFNERISPPPWPDEKQRAESSAVNDDDKNRLSIVHRPIL